jgi:large subunit ribosomal protein L14
MIFKKSWVSIADNTNVRWIQIFHLYNGFNRRCSTDGFFLKGSARVVEPPRIEYKGFKFKFNKKGDICRGLLIRTNRVHERRDASFLRFYQNNVVLIRKKQDLKSAYVYGPISKDVRRKKFQTLFTIKI